MMSIRQRGPCTVVSVAPSNEMLSVRLASASTTCNELKCNVRLTSRCDWISCRTCSTQSTLRTGSMTTRMTPPHGSRKRLASSCVAPNVSTSQRSIGNSPRCARSTRSSSMQPPDTEPTARPSPRRASMAPGGRGLEPKVSTTVTNHNGRSPACHSRRDLSTERSTLSIRDSLCRRLFSQRFEMDSTGGNCEIVSSTVNLIVRPLTAKLQRVDGRHKSPLNQSVLISIFMFADRNAKLAPLLPKSCIQCRSGPCGCPDKSFSYPRKDYRGHGPLLHPAGGTGITTPG